MAAQARLPATDGAGGDDNARLAVVRAVPLCLLHDLVGAAVFLASHPLHAAYLLFFARHLAYLAAFFCPLLFSTTLLLVVLATDGPYLGGANWPGVRSLGRTCGIAVAALCAELQPPDGGGGGGGLIGQLCSFVLGPGDAASVDRVGEIMGEVCDVTGSCFVLQEEEEKSFLLLFPSVDGAIIDGRSFLGYEDSIEGKDEVDEKTVISEDLKRDSECLDECRSHCQERFLPELRAEEEQEIAIQEQGSIPLDMDGAIKEKRLECDPVSVEIKKCEPVQATELDVKEWEPVPAVEMATAVKEFQTCHELVKQRSSIAQRIKLWEAQVSGNFKTTIDEYNDEENSATKFRSESESIKDVKKSVHFEADPHVETHDRKLEAEDSTSKKQNLEQDHGAEFKDVKECVPSEIETFSEIHCRDLLSEETGLASHAEEAPKDAQLETELHEQECGAEQDMQDCKAAQPDHDLQEKEYKESPIACHEREKQRLKSASIASRMHSRTSSDNLIVSEGSPPSSQKEKEWKRTLACKLYEERMQLKLCRDRAVVEGSDNMDMLWEAYEVGGGGSGRKQGGMKAKSSKKVEESVEEDEEEKDEQDDDDDEGGSVRQLCCLQALKFSTKKMSFRGGRPSLSKISKVLKGMAALSRVGSRRSQKG